MSTTSPNKLPPGMVLGPDGKPCKVCTGFKAWTAAHKKKTTSGSSSSTGAGLEGSPAVAAAAGVAFAAAGADVPRDASGLRKDCPADVERLGRHTWTFLHTAAAYYPVSPTPAQRSSMLSLLSALPTLYPCGHCAAELKERVQRQPPDVSGREGLERWMCETHNEVNKRLGKEKFDCDRVGERWRDGWKDGRCDE